MKATVFLWYNLVDNLLIVNISFLDTNPQRKLRNNSNWSNNRIFFLKSVNVFESTSNSFDFVILNFQCLAQSILKGYVQKVNLGLVKFIDILKTHAK